MPVGTVPGSVQWHVVSGSTNVHHVLEAVANRGRRLPHQSAARARFVPAFGDQASRVTSTCPRIHTESVIVRFL